MRLLSNRNTLYACNLEAGIVRLTSIIAIAAITLGCQAQSTTAPSGDSTTQSSAQQDTTQVTEAVFNESGAPEVRIDVPDISCESCVAHVKEALISQPGVREVKVSLEDKVATVAIDRESFKPEDAIAILVDYQFGNSKLTKDDSEAADDQEPAE